MPTSTDSQPPTLSQRLIEVASRFIGILAKYFPDDPIDFHIFQNTYDFSGISPDIFAQACQHFAQNLGCFKLVSNPDKPGGCELVPRFPSFISYLFAGFDPFIEGLRHYYNNNNDNSNNNNSNDNNNDNNDNSNNNNNTDCESNDCQGNDGGGSKSASDEVVSKEECREENAPVEEPAPAKSEEKAVLPREIIELLQKIGVRLPYPRWLWKLLHSKPVEQILQNLTAVYSYKTRKGGLTSILGAVRASINRNWQPDERSTTMSPTGFLEWFEKMKAAGKVLASTKTPDGILVYGPEGECLGRWPEVATQL